MKICAITAEYNPFHTGHAYQIQKAKELSGADYCIAIMSPDFVQRGTPAFLDKYTRTKMALAGGADLVLELPVRYAVSSARNFARGAVGIMNSLGCVDLISFGCEAGTTGILEKAAGILNEEPEGYRILLQNQLKSGKSFPDAREKALIDYLSTQSDEANVQLQEAILGGLLKGPNNILALEYLQASLRLGSRIVPIPVERVGSGYHSSLPGDQERPTHASAEAIRESIHTAFAGSASDDAILSDLTSAALETLSSYIPESSMPLLEEALLTNGTYSEELYSTLLHYSLMTADDLTSYEDISSDLADRIRNLLPNYSTAQDFADRLKTRQFTRTRIDRALVHVFLGLHQKPYEEPGYTRILGFRKASQPLLHEIMKKTQIPVITKPAAARTILTPAQYEAFRKDIQASDLYRMLRPVSKRAAKNDMQQSPVIYT